MTGRTGTVPVGDSRMDYVVLGEGEKTLVVLPGLSARGVHEMVGTLERMCHVFLETYTVYVLDRRRNLPEPFSVRDMAADTAEGMERLRIGCADVLGISQGGMIAQVLALEDPPLVRRAVLAFTLARTNETMRQVGERWAALAERGDWETLNLELFEKTFSEAWRKRFARFLPAVAKMTEPGDLRRFQTMARACQEFDVRDRLKEIRCPVFVIGGREDQVVTGEASEEIARCLRCPIWMYEDLGHAAWQESVDFSRRVYAFLMSDGGRGLPGLSASEVPDPLPSAAAHRE